MANPSETRLGWNTEGSPPGTGGSETRRQLDRAGLARKARGGAPHRNADRCTRDVEIDQSARP